jgi:hypothetical protein
MVVGARSGYHSNPVSSALSTTRRCFADDERRGTKNVKYLDQNVDSAKVQLSPADVKAIRDEIEKVEVVGDRYPGFFAKYSFADTPEL